MLNRAAAQNQGSIRSMMPRYSADKLVLGLVALAVMGYRGAAQGLVEVESAALRAAVPGQIVQLPVLLASRTNFPLVPLEITPAPGPQLLLSDKPETLWSGDGITLRESVPPGRFRLYLYHVPTPGEALKTISASIENLGTESLELRVLRSACPSPSGDYHLVGKTGLLQFFQGNAGSNAPITIAPEHRALLDPKLDATRVSRDQLVHAIYEFEINQPARLTVFQRAAEAASLTTVDHLPLLPQVLPQRPVGNGAGRGLFPNADFAATNAGGFVYDSTNGPAQLILADPKHESWLQGRDGIENAPSRNVGNYGVLYRVRLKWRSGDRRPLALLMCKIPSDSRWCGAQAGAIKVNSGALAGGIVAIPTGKTAFGQPGEAVFLQRFAPAEAGKDDVIEVEYSPPGASCIPTPMLLVPLRR